MRQHELFGHGDAHQLLRQVGGLSGLGEIV
jgi:hypothetical protein